MSLLLTLLRPPLRFPYGAIRETHPCRYYRCPAKYAEEGVWAAIAQGLDSVADSGADDGVL